MIFSSKLFTFIIFCGIILRVVDVWATDVGGDVWGTWDLGGSPYDVIAELRVPPDSSLIIEPGCYIDFQGHYKFIVDDSATLIAVGTPSDSIVFTTANTSTGWHGIRFYSTDDNSELAFCRIEYGKATGNDEDGSGGGVYCYNSSPVIRNSTIRHNSAEAGGSGIYCGFNSAPFITDNDINHNSTTFYGGGIFCRNSAPSMISGNTIRNNSAHFDGGGIESWYSSPTISNNTISENSASHGGGIDCFSSDLTISDNSISNNTAELYGGGILCGNSSSPSITNNTIRDNSALSDGGGVYCASLSNPTISTNSIRDNSAVRGGGVYFSRSNATLSSSTIVGNTSSQSGGGIFIFSSDEDNIKNNTIINNSAGFYGGGIYCWLSGPTMTNNTISRNSADYNGGGLYCNDSSPAIINTILWGNSAPDGSEIYLYSNSNPIVTYSDIEGEWTGEGNIDIDPLFRDSDNNDFHLQSTDCGDLLDSGCIDVGDPTILDSLLDCSMGLGEHISDMGAYGGDAHQTGIGDPEEQVLPGEFLLSQNYPNPFNPSTTIAFDIPGAAFARQHVNLTIYDIRGRRVRILMDSEMNPGRHSVHWNGRNEKGEPVASGIYLYRLNAGGEVYTRKMTILK